MLKYENPFLEQNVTIVFTVVVFGSLLTQFIFKSRSNLITMTGGGWKKIFQKLSITPSKRNEKKPKLIYQHEIESQGINLYLHFSYPKIDRCFFKLM